MSSEKTSLMKLLHSPLKNTDLGNIPSLEKQMRRNKPTIFSQGQDIATTKIIA